jgi:invasion protein IalB
MAHHKASTASILALLMFCMSTAVAHAQDAAPAAAPTAPQNAWVINCSTGAGGTELACQMSQVLTDSKTGQRVLTVTIRKDAAQGGMAMLIALPHGLFLPAGATYQIDGGKTVPVEIQTSDQNGSYAAAPMDAALIGALKAGTTLNIGMESANRQPVVIPVSLAGFTAIIDKFDSLK